MDWGRGVATDFLNTHRLRLEDEPIYLAHDPGMLPRKPRPCQRRRAATTIHEQLVHRPASPLFPGYLRKIAPDGGCPCPFDAGSILDRLRTEARRNRCGIGLVAYLDKRADHVLHALSRSRLCHRVVTPFP